jgi:sulfate transport system permease protein
LPTAVAGIALTAIYARNGWIGSLLDPFDIKIAYTPWGIGVALVFIGLPFMVRTVQPVLEDFEREIEEAAASLGANPANCVPRHAAGSAPASRSLSPARSASTAR